jgi:hypothetical protein
MNVAVAAPNITNVMVPSAIPMRSKYCLRPTKIASSACVLAYTQQDRC